VHRCLPLKLGKIGKVKVHGHCHQKAMHGVGFTLEVLRALGFEVSEIDSGCCGMAGSFGYEKEHYDFSVKIGELKLAPAIRAAPSDTWIVANGVSCRSQIAHLTGRRALHLAELLANHWGQA
jgi:Fe-S oxidoreductase